MRGRKVLPSAVRIANVVDVHGRRVWSSGLRGASAGAPAALFLVVVRERGAAALAAVPVLISIACFWSAILVAAALEPGYRHRRDYLSTLAANGAGHAEVAMFAIVAAAVAMLFASPLVRQLSRPAGVAIALAGVGFVVVAFTRLECPNGAAACGLGGRFEVSGATEVGHWTATTVSSVLLIGGIALTGVALIRRGRRDAGLATLAAAAVTAAAFLATGGETPGVSQRIGIVVATGWLAVFAVATLVRSRNTR